MREGICLVCMECSLWWDFRCTISGVGELDKLPTTCDTKGVDENMFFLLGIVCCNVMYMSTKFEIVLSSMHGDISTLVQSGQIYQYFHCLSAYLPIIGKICKK